MCQETGALEFKTETLAQRGAGKPVDRACGIFAVQDEDIGEQPLDGARIDLALIRNGAAVAQTAPIAHQQM